eukprot:gnl/Dysnectes_brevis/1100_a1231_2839.p1 GENE.gnl/Dysnectes_brevis/1100_a1231_2839~~gnl/Dysnectes_brevis/1100_a1231_2839.p1  ORF type:complete len:309 (-),score=59.98 gnl/Dysnectes_brevis/1100_a1231_2839:123-1001(-)
MKHPSVRAMYLAFSLFLVGVAVLLAVSISLFDWEDYGHYRIFYDAISMLGVLAKNPNGQVYFGLSWGSLIFAQVFFYLTFKHLMTINSLNTHKPFESCSIKFLRHLGGFIHKHGGVVKWAHISTYASCAGMWMIVQYPGGTDETTRIFAWEIKKHTLHDIGAGLLLIGMPMLQILCGGGLDGACTRSKVTRMAGMYLAWAVALFSLLVFAVIHLLGQRAAWIQVRYVFEWAELAADILGYALLAMSVSTRAGPRARVLKRVSAFLEGGRDFGFPGDDMFMIDDDQEVIEVRI